MYREGPAVQITYPSPVFSSFSIFYFWGLVFLNLWEEMSSAPSPSATPSPPLPPTVIPPVPPLTPPPPPPTATPPTTPVIPPPPPTADPPTIPLTPPPPPPTAIPPTAPVTPPPPSPSTDLTPPPPSSSLPQQPNPPSAPPRPRGMSSSSSVHPPPSPGLALGTYQGTFTYEELARATNGFSEANWLGQGGFGYVYRGILRNGKEIAVKQLKAGSAQGEREFQAEVGIISRVHHRHLVALVGYCIADAQRLLVYEFAPNNTLEFHLHGKGRPPLAWSSRLKIAVGSAKGLSYLHENCNPKIIHRDIKAANILLDFKFEAKVADFGLAKIALDTNTHVSTRVMGTFGYLAPEYAASGKLTEKSDVFSFGVVLLELITGRRPVDVNNTYADNSLVDWARPLLTRALEENKFEGLVDPKLNNEYDREEMARMVACAATCVRHSARRRPRMDQASQSYFSFSSSVFNYVTRVLEGNISPSDLNQGIKPGDSNVYSSYGGSTDNDMSEDNEGISKLRRKAFGTQEYSESSGYSNPTSEYDLYSTALRVGPHGKWRQALLKEPIK
ncbi:LOW QUALITY PROTEIN: hypothetical protein HID58_002695, partial [Brassica napus]